MRPAIPDRHCSNYKADLCITNPFRIIENSLRHLLEFYLKPDIYILRKVENGLLSETPSGCCFSKKNSRVSKPNVTTR